MGYHPFWYVKFVGHFLPVFSHPILYALDFTPFPPHFFLPRVQRNCVYLRPSVSMILERGIAVVVVVVVLVVFVVPVVFAGDVIG